MSSDPVNVPDALREDTTTDPGTDEIKELGEVLEGLINEAVHARVRQRALLVTLLAGKPFTWSDYTANFERILDEDGEAIFGHLLLKADAFRQRYGEWAKNDMRKYGFEPRRQHKAAPDIKQE